MEAFMKRLASAIVIALMAVPGIFADVVFTGGISGKKHTIQSGKDYVEYAYGTDTDNGANGIKTITFYKSQDFTEKEIQSLIDNDTDIWEIGDYWITYACTDATETNTAER
jgi:acetate kinase